MTDFVISCDAFARLSNVLRFTKPDINQHFKTIRIDNGIAVASNRIIMAAEFIGGSPGIIHVIPTPALIDQCRKEAAYSSTLTITVNDMLKFGTAKTTLGYLEPGNCCLWSNEPTEFDNWRSIAMATKEAAKISRGAMFWDADNIHSLASASPSGRLVFEEIIDTQGRPTVVRDINDPNWFGLFNPYSGVESYIPATLPSWMKA